MRRLGMLLLVSTVGGCGLFGADPQHDAGPVRLPGPRLADLADSLPAAVDPAQQAAAASLQVPDTAELLASYRQALMLLPAWPAARAVALDRPLAKRLADLEMRLADDHAADGPDHYRVAVAAYQGLLSGPGVDAADAAAVHYQLARAHDLLGEADSAGRHLDALLAADPDPELATEARFRRAELHFSAGAWGAAAADFGAVAATDSPWQRHARYMAGWANFKAGSPDRALPVFVAVLDDLANDVDTGAAARELHSDTLRASVLVLQDLDGVASLAAAMAVAGAPAWQVQLYSALGDWYRERERWLDSARAWEAFLAAEPLHPQAPALHLKVMDTLRDGGFTGDLPLRERAFVEAFAAGGAWQVQHGADALAPWREDFAGFVDTLARTAHARAQDGGARADWLQAAHWYATALATLGEDGELRFTLGDTLAAAGEAQRAVAAWQALVADAPGHPRAADAGYGVVLQLDGLVADGQVPAAVALDARLAFTAIFPGDPRAAAVQVDAATALFAAGRPAQARAAAQMALADLPLDPHQALVARRVLVNASVDLAAWRDAEQFGLALLEDPRLPPADRPAVRDQVLASVFRQGEVAEAAGDLRVAVGHFLRLQTLAPGAAVAVDARFDAAALLLRLDDVDAAVELLDSLRREHPGHRLVADIPARLAALHEAAGRPAAAARELEQVAAAASDREQQRVARYRAAELWLAAGDQARAIDRFRDYAHSWPQPVAVRLEAMHHMDQLYQATGEPTKRRFWLRKLIASHAAAGTAQTGRSRWLAADAAWVLADDAVAAYQHLPLADPLARHLPAKQRAMRNALDALEQVAAYKVVDFTGRATVAMGDLYRTLADGLLAAPAPAGLNDLEAQQYQLLLEEQAFPFEEQAIDLYTTALQQARSAAAFGPASVAAVERLAALVPGRWRRPELEVEHVPHLY